jgi:hypothetical protein
MTNTIYEKPFCTYLTVIIHEDLPFMYIGKGKTKDVISGKYKGSIRSKQYRDIFNKLKKESPHLVQSEVINQFETNEEAIAEEIKLHKLYDVKNCPVFMNKANQTAKGCAFANGLKGEKHPLYGKKHSAETRSRQSAVKKGENNPMFGKNGDEHPMFGKKHSAETKDHYSELRKQENNPMFGKKGDEHPKYGKKHSAETRSRQSAVKKGKPQQVVTCPHCGRSGGKTNMTRYHFDNCKHK